MHSRGLLKVSCTDGELVRQARTGDLAAYGELVARYRPRLGRYALRVLGNREDAEEALQDSLVRSFRALERCANPERFGAWVFAILVNRCRTRWARRDRLDRNATADAAYLAAAVGPGDSELEWREEIQRALLRLPQEQREAFLLKHVEDLSYEEMAAVTRASVSALKMRVNRACERLRAELEVVYRG